jgi:hypothetical protein
MRSSAEFADTIDDGDGGKMSQTILDRVLEPFAECLTPEAATRIAGMRADPETQARLDELAHKANEGQLSPEEATEYDRCLATFHFITMLQAKARALIVRHSGS